MMMLKRRVEFWFTIVALHKIGAVAIPATHLLTPKDLIYRNNSAGIRMIVTADDKLIMQHVEDSLEQSPTVEFIVSTGAEVSGKWISMAKGKENAPQFVRPEVVNTNSDISLLYFTSGSSGQPKMVAHNFLYPLGHIVTAKYWHNVHEKSLHLTVADTGWGKAVWGKLYGQWIVGAAVFVYDHEKFTPADILAVMAKYKVTSFCAPPTIYRFLIREDLSKYDLSSLEYCTTAGEPLNPSVFDSWKNSTGLTIYEGFGQTETTLQVDELGGITSTQFFRSVLVDTVGRTEVFMTIHIEYRNEKETDIVHNIDVLLVHNHITKENHAGILAIRFHFS